MIKTIVIIQARMTSSRLPGKILKFFSNGLSILDMQINTINKIIPYQNIYIATTSNKQDDIIEATYGKICNVFRGDEDDVLSRFLEITKMTNAKNVIRVSSDNPFIFLEGIEFLLKSHMQNKSDYTTFSIENIPSMLVPAGLFVEIVSSKALFDMELKASVTEKEHVTFALYTRLKKQYKVNLVNIRHIYPELNNKNFRFTVDTLEDYSFIDAIIKNLQITMNEAISIDKINQVLSYVKDEHLEGSMIFESNKKKNIKKYDKEEYE